MVIKLQQSGTQNTTELRKKKLVASTGRIKSTNRNLLELSERIID